LTLGGLRWAYNDSSFLASLGAGGVGQLGGLYYINLDGLSGVAVSPIIPEPGTAALLMIMSLMIGRYVDQLRSEREQGQLIELAQTKQALENWFGILQADSTKMSRVEQNIGRLIRLQPKRILVAQSDGSQVERTGWTRSST
jgi:hypothetical protein